MSQHPVFFACRLWPCSTFNHLPFFWGLGPFGVCGVRCCMYRAFSSFFYRYTVPRLWWFCTEANVLLLRLDLILEYLGMVCPNQGEAYIPIPRLVFKILGKHCLILRRVCRPPCLRYMVLDKVCLVLMTRCMIASSGTILSSFWYVFGLGMSHPYFKVISWFESSLS